MPFGTRLIDDRTARAATIKIIDARKAWVTLDGITSGLIIRSIKRASCKPSIDYLPGRKNQSYNTQASAKSQGLDGNFYFKKTGDRACLKTRYLSSSGLETVSQCHSEAKAEESQFYNT
jgi:hypothetical protein